MVLSILVNKIRFVLFLVLLPFFASGQAFITTWKTDNPGSSTDTQIAIPTTGTGYDYNIVWTEVGVPSNTGTINNITGDVTIDFPSAGTYRVEITGQFPRIYFNAASYRPDKDSRKLLTVEQWGSIAWTSMASAFSGCVNMRINAVDAPDLTNVTSMSEMFYEASVMDDNINHWNVSNITSMFRTFNDAEAFNQPLDGWDVSNVIDMTDMFAFANSFNQNISSWTVDNVQDMSSMFAGASSFNQNIGGWNISQVTSLDQMFAYAVTFNQDISAWNTINVSDMNGVFDGAASFNQDISGWNLTNVTRMSRMFRRAVAFNQDVTGLDVSNVTNLSGMFSFHPTFNQDITGWNVSGVTDLSSMFEGATAFNQNISTWDVSAVRDFNAMFNGATAFNQPLAAWILHPTLNIDMRNMFDGATSFDQDLSGWNVANLAQAHNMFNNSGLSVSNYDNLLEGWSSQSVKSNVTFGAQGIYYCSAQTARDILTNATNNWNITDAGSACLFAYDGPDTSAPEILNGQPELIEFGSIDVLPSVKTRSFTIVNTQGSLITNVVVAISGSAFSTSAAPVTIPSGGTHTFVVTLSGSGSGTFLETVTITSDNFSGTFQFDLSGSVTLTPEPEIAVFEGTNTLSTPITSGQVTPIDLGYEVLGNFLMREVTITNIGSADLDISTISITGTEFFLGSTPPATIPVDGSETIQIMVSGSSAGSFIETITIESDDTDEAMFEFILVATIEGPDLAVYDGTDIFSDPEIFDGQVTPVDFGSGPQGNDITIPITLANWNRADLNISNITITGTAFTLASTPPTFIAAEVDGVISRETIDIILSGVAGGTFNETITINSDDPFKPNFTFPITGTITGSGCVTPPTAAVGLIANICEGSNIVLSGSIGGSATLSTWSTGGDGSFDDASILNAVYTPGPNDIISGTVNLSLSTDDPDGAGPCNAASALVFVTIGQTATVDAGADQTICTTDIATLTGTMGQAANNPSWGTSGTGVFSSPNTLSSDYTPSAEDIAAGSVTLTLTVDATGVCPQVSDQIILNISQTITAGAPSVQGNVGQTTLVDVIASSGTTSANVSAVTITQNPSQGVATVNPDNSINYVPDTGTIGADSFDYEICNQCGQCDTGSVSIDILNQPPVFTAPSTPPPVLPGQVITILITDFLTDPNNNIDLASVTNLTTTGSGILSYDGNGTITLDYTNATFSGNSESISFRIFDTSMAFVDVTILIDVIGEIITYNGVSPNGDGFNDHFEIENIQFLEPNNKVVIYNRWGDKVFEVENYNPDDANRRFEGKQNDGKELPSGVYFYKVEFVSGRSSLNGYLTLKK